jgi:glutamyl-tRNA synthetase
MASGARPSLRARLDGTRIEWSDAVLGEMSGISGDPVIRRADSTPSYCLAVVVDDSDQGIDQVVRGDDLASSVPEQAGLAGVLDITPPVWAHVPLALGPTGKRLAKRDGAVTLKQRTADGESPSQTLSLIASSIGLCEPSESVDCMNLVARFNPTNIPRHPWTPETS